jgi:exonuclease III
MKLYSWNVNGIRAVWNKGLFQKFIEEHDPDPTKEGRVLSAS